MKLPWRAQVWTALLWILGLWQHSDALLVRNASADLDSALNGGSCGAVIMTTFFTTMKDWQRPGPLPDPSFSRIKTFYDSILAADGVQALVLYDRLPKELIERATSPGKFTFSQVDISSYDTSLGVNDVRFLIFRDVLSKHAEYGVVFTSDLFDVQVLRNPCPLVEDAPDSIYVGSEVRDKLTSPWMEARFKDMGGKYMTWYFSAVASGDRTIYSAGLLGGERQKVLDFLDRMAAILEDPELRSRQEGREVNIDMGAFNWIVYNDMKPDEVVTGHPLHSTYKEYHAHPGDYFKHKFF
mmetsp:Transcript_43199/g.99595  ORF Transcript_43199/g.99595 Transcript_43199/m.99595 type:complete len:297 (-) Transcript_43199:85-975(-)